MGARSGGTHEDQRCFSDRSRDHRNPDASVWAVGVWQTSSHTRPSLGVVPRGATRELERITLINHDPGPHTCGPVLLCYPLRIRIQERDTYARAHSFVWVQDSISHLELEPIDLCGHSHCFFCSVQYSASRRSQRADPSFGSVFFDTP